MNYQMLRDMIAARPKSFAFLLFLALLTLGLYLYLSGHQRPELARVQTEWFAKRDALARGENVTRATQYRNGERDLALFDRRIISKKSFPSYLERLFQSAKRNSVVLKTVTYKPAPVTGQPDLVSYGIGLSVSGKYGAVKSFIAELERSPEIVTLDSLSLASTSRTEEAVDLKLQLTAYLKTEGA